MSTDRTPDTPATKPTLLVVDDEPDVLESLRHLFHRRYRVLSADNGADALRLVETENVQVILSDQRMPGMTGDELLTRARAVRPEATRLLFTGYADLQAVTKAVNQGGIFRYILKPWDAAELEAVIQQAAEQNALLVERRRLMEELQTTNAQLLESNRELAEANALKSAFLEVASHELNTPITIIQGLSDLLLLLNPDRDPHDRELIEQLSNSAQHLGRLVTNMLKLMLANDFRHPLKRQSADLNALLQAAIDPLLPFIQARQLHLDLRIEPHLGQFLVDPDKILDVVSNLLSNAIKFTPDAGRLAVEAHLVDDGQTACIVVQDEGIGLEPRALEHLFDPFFTEFDPAYHSSGDFGFNKRGMGLGLSLVKRFVERHGGSVLASSQVGQGTRIEVRLPRTGFPEPEPVLEFNRSGQSSSLDGRSDSALS